MTTAAPLAYWTPGSEERQLRIFVSHRYDKDQALYGEVFQALHREGIAVQDISLSAQQVLEGPRGGKLPEMTIQAEIAARIYTSDIVIAPSTSGVSHSEWVTWEVQLAAIGYGIPVLFVNQIGQQRNTRLVKEIEGLDLPCDACDPITQEIVRKVIELAKGRPTWGVRDSEPDASLRFRGPPAEARTKVLRQFPFQARLADIAGDAHAETHKPSLWQRFSGKNTGV